MKQTLRKTFALKALMLVAMLVGSFNAAWANEVTLKYSGTTTTNMTGSGNEAATLGLDADEWSVVATKNSASNNIGLNQAGDIRLYYNANGGNTLTVSSLTNATINSITITFTGANYSKATVTVDGETVTGEDGVYEINSTSFVIGNGNSSNVQVRISKIVIDYTPGGNVPTLDESDFALTGTTALFFDLYDDAEAQVINYTTSSTGAVTVAENDYVNVEVGNGTLTVTPLKKTNGAVEITVNQAKDDDYKAGSATFTVTITDSTPVGDVSEETIAIKDLGFANGADLTECSGKVVTLTWDKGTNNNNTPKAYNGGEEARLYGGNTVTFKATKAIEKIEFTYSSGYEGTNFKASAGAMSDGTWVGNATEITLTNSGTSQIRFTEIKITYADENDPSVATNVVIDDASFDNEDLYYGTDGGVLVATVYAGEAALTNATVTWSSSNEEVATIAQDGKVTLVGVGTTEITASYAGEEGSYKPSLATYTLKVINTDPNVPGSEYKPYTVAEARAAIDAGTGITGVYATGIVSKIVTAFNAQYGNISYNISEDGSEEAAQLYAYRGKDKDGVWFTSEDDVQVGDVVVIYGNLTKYGDTYEFAADNQRVSFTRTQQPGKADPELAFSAQSAVATIGEAFTVPTLTTAKAFDGTVIYFSSNEDIATVNAQTGEVTLVAPGFVTITASCDATENFTAGAACYDLTVKKATVTPSGDNFVKVTSADALEDGAYLIVYEDDALAFNGGLETLDVSKNTISVTIENDAIAKTDDNMAAIFTITAEGEGYTIQAANGKYIGQTSDTNGLKAEDNAITNTISFTADGDASIVAGGAYLRYNATSGQERFRYYKSNSYSNQKPVHLYKLGGEPDTRQEVTLAFGENIPSTINLNETATYAAIASEDGLEITYESNDDAVVSVDATTGEITALAVGKATITATFAGTDVFKPATAKYTISVVDPRQEVTLTFGNVPNEININETATYAATADVDGLTITYASSNENILTVDAAGKITAKAKGDATITATFAGNDSYKPATASYTISVVDPNAQTTYYALVGELNGEYFALTNSVSGGTFAATQVGVVNGKVVTPQNDDIAWEIRDGSTVYIVNKAKNEQGNPQYLGHGSNNTTLTIQNASSDTQSKWTADTDKNTWVNGNRSFIYRTTAGGFKNYATSNVNKDDYASFTTAYEFAEGYSRVVANGAWGTICLPNNVAATDYVGAKFYTVFGKVLDAQGNPTKIGLQEVTGALEAGKPYIFNASSTMVAAAYGTVTADAAGNDGVLFGSFEGADVAEGMYLLSGGKVVKCGTGCSIGANRAYIDLSNAEVKQESDLEGLVKFFVGDSADAINAINAAQNGAVVYDLAGRRVNAAKAGLYIVNGKKVAVK